MSNITLSEITTAVQRLLETRRRIEDAEQQLKELKKEEQILSEETVPCMLEELGLKEISLSTGQKITVSADVYASIPKDRYGDAVRWLDEHGFGDIVKTKVILTYNRDQRLQAKAVSDNLSEKGFPVSLDESVHPSTLKAFLKEQLRKGTDIPLELFGAHPVSKTVIKK